MEAMEEETIGEYEEEHDLDDLMVLMRFTLQKSS